MARRDRWGPLDHFVFFIDGGAAQAGGAGYICIMVQVSSSPSEGTNSLNGGKMRNLFGIFLAMAFGERRGERWGGIQFWRFYWDKEIQLCGFYLDICFFWGVFFWVFPTL